MRRLWLLLLAGATLGAQQPSAKWEHQFGGYYKSLFSASHTIITQDSYGDWMNRLRLSYDGRYGEWFEAHVDYDNEAHFGNLIEHPEFALVRRRQDPAWLDLQHIVLDKTHAYWDTSIYRGYVRLRSGGTALTAGRQRIGWGTARFWSPADAFNPLNPLQIEPEERAGVDAGYFEWDLAGNLTWSTAYLPQNSWNGSTVATRISSNVAGSDVAAFVGRFEEDWMAGAEFAGQFRGAGLRAEATYRWREEGSALNNPFRMTVGADYAWANTLYVVGEYFYNQGQPTLDPSFDPASLLRYTSEIFTTQRHFLNGGATYDITPLFRVEGYVIADVAGGGVFFMPQAKYNLTPNTDLTAGGQFFASQAGGEFEPLSNVFFAEFAVHF